MNNESRIKDFTDLNTWKNGHELVLNIYKITGSFPDTEKFGLVTQMRRSAVSITSNVAEGFSRRSYADKKHFYVMSHGSLTELQNQLIVARDVGYLNIDSFERSWVLSITVHKLLSGLIKSTKEMHAS